MMKRKLYEAAMGALGVVAIGAGIVRCVNHSGPDGLLLAGGIVSFFMCLQSFSGASGEARLWMGRTLAWIVIAYGTLELFIERREEFWGFLGVLSSVAIIFFTIMHAKGYRWRRDEAKTLPPAKEG